MDIAICVGVYLTLAAVLVDVVLSARFGRPFKRRQANLELARIAVASAEQFHRGQKKAGPAKARYARQFLIDHGVSPTHAHVLVEKAVTDIKQPTPETP